MHEDLCTNLQNDTRWTSVFSMLPRNVALREYVSQVDNTDLDVLMWSAICARRVDLLVHKLAELNDAFVKLQSDDCTICQAEVHSNSVLDVYPTLESCFHFNALIVHSPNFELGVLNLQSNKEDDLTAFEKFVLQECLLLSETSFDHDESPPEQIIHPVLKQQKRNTVAN